MCINMKMVVGSGTIKVHPPPGYTATRPRAHKVACDSKYGGCLPGCLAPYFEPGSPSVLPELLGRFVEVASAGAAPKRYSVGALAEGFLFPRPLPGPSVVRPRTLHERRDAATGTGHAAGAARSPTPPSRADLGPDQRAVYDAVVEGRQSCFITGNAGTGKSFLLRVMIDALKARDARRVCINLESFERRSPPPQGPHRPTPMQV